MPQEEDFFESVDSNNDPAHGKAGGNSRRRILLLVLLLLVIVAAAVFYLGPGLLTPEIARTPAPPPKKKIVKLPPPKSPEKKQPAKKQQQVPEKGVVEEKISEQPVAAQEKTEEPEKKPTAAPAPEKAVQEAQTAEAGKSVAKEETEPEAKVAKEKAEPEARVAEDEGEPVAGVGGEPTSEPVVSGRFVLQAGAYLMEENLEAVSRTVERLGYRPRLDQGTKTVEMTRLKVGTYDERSARKKLQEVRRLAPDAFTLGEDGRVGVYAGSYYNLDRARVFADRLYSQGVRVEEEDVVVELPITIVRFGAFEDRSEAENVARQARDNGLEIAVVEKR